MTTKTRKEIIDETARFYNSQNRAEATDGCYYLLDGRKCAVGRCMKNPQADWSSIVTKLFSYCGVRLENELLPEYQGHSMAFWRDVQMLHDAGDNWTDSGLSDQGRERVSEVHSEWDERTQVQSH